MRRGRWRLFGGRSGDDEGSVAGDRHFMAHAVLGLMARDRGNQAGTLGQDHDVPPNHRMVFIIIFQILNVCLQCAPKRRRSKAA
jgi:hypothetical protein